MDQLAGPSERKCLICGAKTSSCHLGVDACRACTVFYRRAKTRKLNACRSNKLRCGIETGALTCKRCRFDRFERILKESGAKEMLDVSHLEEREPSPALAGTAPSGGHHPEMNEQETPIFPATLTALNNATSIALSAILEFAGYMFPEFSHLSSEEKWSLAVSFFYRFQAFDSCYRSEKKYPDDLVKLISYASITCYFDEEAIEGFFDCCTEVDAKNIEEAKKLVHDILYRVFRPCRLAIPRSKPDSDEFHAVLVILFWFTDGMQLRDEIVQIGEWYRADMLQELHTYYRQADSRN